ncbi:MAG: dTDP-4-dehydrorhamnose reductase [Leptolyngbya sp. RL_3_1]|nr:dTDP-4-dehydrorhamnose reductase [Leptolyngbya sp. RL_3_1]
MSRVLLLGKGGQVGQVLLRRLTAAGMKVVACDRRQLDFEQPAQIQTLVADLHPQLIINAAAYTAVDRAEVEITQAQRVNAEAPEQLAMAAAACGTRLMHFSTDYVFDGQSGIPWREGDNPNPLGIYGQTKLAGEMAIRQMIPDQHWIIRTAWVYGATGPRNFVKTMVRLGQTRDRIRVVCDQVGTPTWTEDLAQVVVAFVQDGDRVPPGTYHYTNSGVASWYDLAIAIFEEVRALGIPLMVKEVQPIPSQDYPTAAKRPFYSVLDCQKITALLGYRAPHWRVSLRTMLSQYLEAGQS